jgi:hypothetical protein
MLIMINYFLQFPALYLNIEINVIVPSKHVLRNYGSQIQPFRFSGKGGKVKRQKTSKGENKKVPNEIISLFPFAFSLSCFIFHVSAFENVKAKSRKSEMAVSDFHNFLARVIFKLFIKSL